MIETLEQYERVKQDKHLVVLDSVGYGNTMIYASDLTELIESLRTVARAASDIHSPHHKQNILDALDALPRWVLEEN